MREAGEAPDIDAWVRERLGSNSVDTVLTYCVEMHRRGAGGLARQIAQSTAIKEKVVPNSKQLADGSYGENMLPQGCMFVSEFRRRLARLGIMDSVE